MHPDVEPYARDVAKKQEAFWKAWSQLKDSTAEFRANIDSLSYYAVSKEHQQIFDQWIEASRALDEAVRTMHEHALRAAGIPEDHPLWAFARKKTE